MLISITNFELLLSLYISIFLFIDFGQSAEFSTRVFNAITITTLTVPFIALGAQVYRFRHASAVERQQMKWGFWGIIIWIVLISVTLFGTFYLIPSLNNPTWKLMAQFILVPLPNYASVLITIFIVFAITRNRLWDIDIVINKSLVYSSIGLLVIALFAAITVALQIVIGQTQPLIALIVASAFSALLFRPVTNRVQNWVDRYIYRLNFNLNELAAAQKLPEILKPGMLSGKNLDGYEVRDVLGHGGMGEVYKGFGNERTVAIKTMLSEIAQDPDMRKRFEREAQAGMQLDHPHIAKVYAHGEINGTPYLVMAYIEGQDLSHLLKTDGKLDEETTARILQDVCAALDVAHGKGFIHRDLKPSNIMIQPNGQAILMDFGITKMTNASTSLTGTGAIGTIDYMAPEQIMSSKEVDKRADIYALGVMLYEMLTGEKPFKGIPAQILFAHLQQPVSDAQAINPDIPDKLVEVVERAMSKNPEDRFQSAGEFAAALKLN
jgi:predicted Ser/Thr protein kinase